MKIEIDSINDDDDEIGGFSLSNIDEFESSDLLFHCEKGKSIYDYKENKNNISYNKQELSGLDLRTLDNKSKCIQELEKIGKAHRKNKFPKKEKEQVIIAKTQHNMEIKEIMALTKICKKNIQRWIENGIERKKGAGRKMVNQQMELDIIKWTLNEIKTKSFVNRGQTGEKGNHRICKKSKKGGFQGIQGLVRQIPKKKQPGVRK